MGKNTITRTVEVIFDNIFQDLLHQPKHTIQWRTNNPIQRKYHNKLIRLNKHTKQPRNLLHTKALNSQLSFQQDWLLALVPTTPSVSNKLKDTAYCVKLLSYCSCEYLCIIYFIKKFNSIEKSYNDFH